MHLPGMNLAKASGEVIECCRGERNVTQIKLQQTTKKALQKRLSKAQHMRCSSFPESHRNRCILAFGSRPRSVDTATDVQPCRCHWRLHGVDEITEPRLSCRFEGVRIESHGKSSGEMWVTQSCQFLRIRAPKKIKLLALLRVASTPAQICAPSASHRWRGIAGLRHGFALSLSISLSLSIVSVYLYFLIHICPLILLLSVEKLSAWLDLLSTCF